MIPESAGQVPVTDIAKYLKLVDHIEQPRPGCGHGDFRGCLSHQPRERWIKMKGLSRGRSGDNRVTPPGQPGRCQMLG